MLNFCLVGFFIVFLMSSPVGFPMDICTLGGSALVNGRLGCYEFLICVSSWFTCWVFSWYAPLTGTLEGTSGGGSFPNISDRDINYSLWKFPSLTSGMSGAGLFISWIKSDEA